MPTMEEVNEETNARELAKIRDFPHHKSSKKKNYSKINDNICQYHKNGETKKDYFLKNEILKCNYAKEKGCPYGNSQNLSWDGRETSMTICLSKGLIKKLEEINSE